MSEIKPGTRVHVEFDGQVESSVYGGVAVKTKTGQFGGYTALVPIEAVTVIEPTDWEKYGGARVGDIWEAAGKEFFVQDYGGCVPIAVSDTFYGAGGRSYSLDRNSATLDEFKELNPRLVRRRGVQIEGR